MFQIEIDDVEGSLSDLYVGVDFQIIERLAFGLGWNSVNIDVDAEGSEFNGSVDWTYDGALLYFKLGFGSVE